jgi:hypothetical protein
MLTSFMKAAIGRWSQTTTADQHRQPSPSNSQIPAERNNIGTSRQMPGSMVIDDAEHSDMETDVDELTQNFEEMTDLDANTVGQRSVSL